MLMRIEEYTIIYGICKGFHDFSLKSRQTVARFEIVLDPLSSVEPLARLEIVLDPLASVELWRQGFSMKTAIADASLELHTTTQVVYSI